MEITIEQLLESIDLYEQKVWKAVRKDSLASISESLKRAVIYERPRGTRQIVVPSVHKMPRVQLTTLLPELGRLIEQNQDLPDSVLVVSVEELSGEVRQTFSEMMLSGYQVSLDFLAGNALGATSEFEYLFAENEAKESFVGLDDTQKLLYDLLAEGQNVSDIKAGLVCSVIVFVLYEHGPQTIDKTLLFVQDKLGKEVGSIQQEMMFLRKNKRIEPLPTNTELLRLTDKEEKRVVDARERMKREEKAFFSEFIKLLEKYGITEEQEKLFGILRQMYENHCGVSIDKRHRGSAVNGQQRMEGAMSEFQKFLQERIKNKDAVKVLTEHLKDLCASNNYLSKVGASESFLSLFRSKRLERYIGGKHKHVYLDTPVFVFYLCSKSGLLPGITDWQDHGYKSTINMMSLKNNRKIDVKFHIANDYIGEAVGELRKALRMAWFAERHTFAIPFETSNTFYNYYQFLKEECELDGDDTIKDFASFAKHLGFSVVDPEHLEFESSARYDLTQRLKIFGVEVCKPVQIPTDLFIETLKEYEKMLAYNERKKSPEARKADVRQCIRLAALAKEEGDKDNDFYFASWDYSTIKLRKWLVRKDSLTYDQYTIYNPAQIASKLSLSHFNINAKNITDDIFFYADVSYNLTEKIRRLYDEVIIPLFGYQERQDLQAVNFILELQQQYLSQLELEMTDVELPKKLPLEIIFTDIRQSISDKGHSEQDLSIYLNDAANLDYLKNFFTSAFDEVAKEKALDELISTFCTQFETYIRETNESDGNIPI